MNYGEMVEVVVVVEEKILGSWRGSEVVAAEVKPVGEVMEGSLWILVMWMN